MSLTPDIFTKNVTHLVPDTMVLDTIIVILSVGVVGGSVIAPSLRS